MNPSQLIPRDELDYEYDKLYNKNKILQEKLDGADIAISSANSDIEFLIKAIHGIAPWLSASLSDKSYSPCKEYVDACNAIFDADKHNLIQKD